MPWPSFAFGPSTGMRRRNTAHLRRTQTSRSSHAADRHSDRRHRFQPGQLHRHQRRQRLGRRAGAERGELGQLNRNRIALVGRLIPCWRTIAPWGLRGGRPSFCSPSFLSSCIRLVLCDNRRRCSHVRVVLSSGVAMIAFACATAVRSSKSRTRSPASRFAVPSASTS